MDKIFELIDLEEKRQKEQIQLIPSENMVSEEVKKALGSCLTHKYAEGYSGRRYYQGNKIIDEIENLAVERGKKLFNVSYLNVQPYSGSPANAAVLMALLDPGDKIAGLKLSAGGHLTHGHPKITFSGKFFESVQYDVEPDGRIDYGKLKEFVLREKPRLIFAGTTAYPFILDWEKFREIADIVGAYLVADISHIAGLVVGGVHPNPMPNAHIFTSTTHKTLRGPRGAIIGTNDVELAKKIDRAVFPGIQGGPHMNNIAAMAVAFGEANTLEFKEYAHQVVKNAKALADALRAEGLKVFGTENHLMLVDVGVDRGKEMAEKLEGAGIIVNANTIPHDPGSPMKPSGIRIGTPWVTSLGMREEGMIEIAKGIAKVVG